MQLGLGLLTRGVDVDSVLSGPTNQMWIDPWVAHLESLGVKFESGAPVRHIHVDRGRISHVTIEQDGRATDVKADYYVAALPVEVMTSLLTEDLKSAAPSLANIGRLRTAWMNGIQFYLGRRAPIVNGHIVYCDSPWALTSVSQDQSWGSVDLTEYGDGEVKGILSVDIFRLGHAGRTIRQQPQSAIPFRDQERSVTPDPGAPLTSRPASAQGRPRHAMVPGYRGIVFIQIPRVRESGRC